MSSQLRELPNRPIVLRNTTCPYCGIALDRQNSSKEHVVGRRFVLPGTLHQNWNLILRACTPCNNHKSDLEDDISALSLQPTAAGQYARPDSAVIAEAARRAGKTFSRRTRKLVGESAETFSVEMLARPGVRISASLRTQPQADEDRIFQLAGMHTSAFFYFVTYDEGRRSGGFWPGGFHPLLFSLRADWGNTVQRAFMSAVVSWEPRFLGGTADGMFKITIRRHQSAECWAWALEWNENIRVIGFLGDFEAAKAIVATFQRLQMSLIPQPDGSQIGVRTEVALAPEDDRMFYWSDEPVSIP